MSEENIIEFLTQATVLDLETTGKDPETCEICEIATGRIEDGWKPRSQLLKTEEPIPPEASSKHLISNRMVEEKPTFKEYDFTELVDMLHADQTEYYVAHNSEFDRLTLKNNLDKAGIKCPDHVTSGERWICTWRLAKAIYGVDFDSMQYSLQYLRFYLDLDVPDDTPAHRADADVITCGKLLETLTFEAVNASKVDDTQPLGPQLYELAWAPVEILTFPFGKHKGKKLSEIPTDYYVWAMNNLDSLQEGNANYDRDLAQSIANVLEKRI